MSGTRNRDRTILIFGSVYGPPPWICFMCCGEIEGLGKGVIHHLDEDHSNDNPNNLVPLHRTCHSSHHNTGVKHPMYGRHHTEESKLLISQNRPDTSGPNNAMFGKQHTDETKAKMAAVRRGVPKSEEHRTRIGIANRGKNARLLPDQVLEIRRLWALNELDQDQLAEMFGVGQTNISQIVRRKTWKYL